MKVNWDGKILSVSNCELAHSGVGLGMKLDGGNVVLILKELDFLLLGRDQLANTFNFIRAHRSLPGLGSFTVFTIVCDQGYQGSQSSLNSAGDIATLANIADYCLNSTADAYCVIQDQLVSPGLRIVCTSQRLFGATPLDLPVEVRSPDNAIFKYLSSDDDTVVFLTLHCARVSQSPIYRLGQLLDTHRDNGLLRRGGCGKRAS